MEQRQLLPFHFAESVLEPIGERRAERAGASFAGLVGEGRLAGAEASDERFDLLLRLKFLPQGLAHDDGERQRVALSEGEKRAPSLYMGDPSAVLIGQGTDE